MVHEAIAGKIEKLIELRCRRDVFSFLENVMGSPSAEQSLIEIRREIRQTWLELKSLRLATRSTGESQRLKFLLGQRHQGTTAVAR